MTARDVTSFLHTRSCAALATVIAVIATIVAYCSGDVVEVTGNRGMIFPSANMWIAQRGLSLAVSLLLMVLLAVACVWVNKTFNIMRAITGLWTSLFVISMAALPTVAGQFYGGTFMAVVIVVCTVLMLSCFGDKRLTRRVYLMFFLLATTALFQYAVMFYIVVLFLGLAQMRILNIRSVVAALLGIITPVWVLFGCGIVKPEDVRVPEFVGTLSVLNTSEMIVTFIAIGLTMLLGVVAMCGNLIKMLSYTAKFRSSNGFMVVALLCTIIFIFIDNNNLMIYVPVLNLLAAYQMAHFMSNHRSARSFLVILSVVALYAALYAAGFLF